MAISLLSGFGSSAMALVAGIWILDLTGSTSLAALAGLCVYARCSPARGWAACSTGCPDGPRHRRQPPAGRRAAGAPRGAGSEQAWLIYAVSCAYGVSYVLIDAGETALLPSALSPSELANVNGWRSSAQEGMKLVAPWPGRASTRGRAARRSSSSAPQCRSWSPSCTRWSA
ncbi:hypothetical protein NKG94_45560 [Micromonospora sp. M12]